jgi:hypothetical protein
MTEKTNEDRADIYAAMSEIEDSEAADRAARNPFLKNTSSRVNTIPLADGKTVEVPSVEYVQELERFIRQQAKQLEKYERQFHRIDAHLRTQRAHINVQGTRINGLNQELDQKIDRRD